MSSTVNPCRKSTRPAAVMALTALGLLLSTHVSAAEPSLDVDAVDLPALSEQTSTQGWGTGDHRSYLVPAIEVPLYELLLNRFDHYHEDQATYPAPFENFKVNLHRSWVVDNDKFSTNQFLHPYSGSDYQGFARSAGLDFWQASAYTFGGSLLWEEAGENTAPSINDQVATGIGGNFLGEPLFRMANLLLERESDHPGWLRELAAGVLSPPTAINRLVFGDRFTPLFPSNDPAVFTSQEVSANAFTHYTSDVNVNADPTAPPSNQNLQRARADSSFTIGYGLPGKPDYTYDRPFDYFNFDVGLDTATGVESVFSRGLLYGTNYGIGDSYRGIWGVYGLYDYAAPNIFRVSSTAGAFGTTGQWWVSRRLALQETALFGVGYAAGGVIHGAGVTAPSPLGGGQRNYHYGVAPESLIALRLIYADRAALDTTARGWYISKVGATESTGSETIERVDVGLTMRVYGQHGIFMRYRVSNRDGRYVGEPNSHQRVATLNIGYIFIGQEDLGAVDWRSGTVQ